MAWRSLVLLTYCLDWTSALWGSVVVKTMGTETMTARNAAGIEIPSLFVSDLTGFALAGNYLHNYGYYVTVQGDGGREPSGSMNTLLMWIVVGVLSVFIMMGILIMRCIRDKPSQCFEKGAPCKDKQSSESTLKGPHRSKEEEANSYISRTVA